MPKIWIPSGRLSKFARFALAVDTSCKPTASLWIDLLGSRLQREIDAEPSVARATLQSSSESSPQMWAIANGHLMCEWGRAVAYSDALHTLSNRIDWDRPGRVLTLPLPTLCMLVEQLP